MFSFSLLRANNELITLLFMLYLQEAYCHCGKKDKCQVLEKISYKTIEKHNPEKLKVALALYGPGSIAVQCARKTFKFYSSGIYDDPKCS